ncbi:hypothetical protein [Cryptosporangium minutisporangium]
MSTKARSQERDAGSTRRPLVFLCLFATATLLLAAWIASLPGTAVLWLIGCGCAVVTTVVAGVVAGARARPGGRAPWFAIAALTPVIALVALCAGLPLSVRWGVSQSAFERALGDAEPSCPDLEAPHDPRLVGAYRVTLICRHAGNVFFFEVHGEPDGFAGFVRARQALPEQGRPDDFPGGVVGGPVHYRSLGDGWYAFSAIY